MASAKPCRNRGKPPPSSFHEQSFAIERSLPIASFGTTAAASASRWTRTLRSFATICTSQGFASLMAGTVPVCDGRSVPEHSI